MKNTSKKESNNEQELINELVETVEKYPICNTIVFNTYKEDKKLTAAIKELLSSKMNKDYKIIVDEPNEDHPEGTCHLAFIPENPMTLKDLFNNLHK